MLYKKNIIAYSVLLTSIVYGKPQSQITTEANCFRSECVDLPQCGQLLPLIFRVKSNDQAAKLELISKHCGFSGPLPRVCCNREALTSPRPVTTQRPNLTGPTKSVGSPRDQGFKFDDAVNEQTSAAPFREETSAAPTRELTSQEKELFEIFARVLDITPEDDITMVSEEE